MVAKKVNEFRLCTDQVVKIESGSRYILKINKYLNNGSFGVVHRANMIEMDNKKAIIKCEMTDDPKKPPQLKQERNVYRYLDSLELKLIYYYKTFRTDSHFHVENKRRCNVLSFCVHYTGNELLRCLSSYKGLFPLKLVGKKMLYELGHRFEPYYMVEIKIYFYFSKK